MIWDDKKRKFVYEFGFPMRVVAVRMRRDRCVDVGGTWTWCHLFSPNRLIVVLMTEIHVFSFPESPKLLTTISTAPNPRGGARPSHLRIDEMS